jgi:hypothetical protein
MMGDLRRPVHPSTGSGRTGNEFALEQEGQFAILREAAQ